MLRFFFFKRKTAYEMRISDWSSDVCASSTTKAMRAAYPMVWKPSDVGKASHARATAVTCRRSRLSSPIAGLGSLYARHHRLTAGWPAGHGDPDSAWAPPAATNRPSTPNPRSEEHTSELQSLMR